MSRVAVAVAVGVLLVVGVLVIDLSQHGDRLAGSNTVVEISGLALPIHPGASRCAPHQNVPAGAALARVYAGTYGRPGGPFAISITSIDGRLVSVGRAAGRYPDNSILRVPITPVRHDLYDATVCLRNPGRDPLKFAGNRTPTAGVRIPGPEAIRYDWLLADHPSWWDVAPRVATRFAVVKPGFVESWTFWAVFVAFAMVCAAAIAVLVRRPAE